MGTLELLGSGFAAAFTLWSMSIIILGLLIGVVAGAVPGISFVNAMAMALPFTYTMDITTAMLFLGGMYVGGVFGGSISSILINVPGSPASLPACWEGYPMTKRGEAKKALTIAITASAFGGLTSAILLTFLAAPFAGFALSFSQPEFFAATFLGLISVVAIAKDQPAVTMVSLLIGIVVGSVGVDPLYGMARFTFGIPAMESGIRFVVVMIGLFAIGEVVDLIVSRRDLRPKRQLAGAKSVSFSDIWAVKGAVLRGTGLGCALGIMPGAGATPGAVIAYSMEKQTSSQKAQFGKGAPDGLAAPEASKNATTGTAMIPLLTLGIPGSAATAIMLAAMMLQGVNPGPLLFLTDPTMVYTIFAAMLIANVLMIAAGIGVAQFFTTLMKTPPAIMASFIIILSLVGAFGLRNNLFDVWVCLGFGLIGWVMRRINFPTAPLVLGVILGPLAERYFMTTMANFNQDWTVILTRPISGSIMALSLVFVCWALYPNLKALLSRRNAKQP